MFRPATEHDLTTIAAIYEEILDQEETRPVSYTNWSRGEYPTLRTAQTAFEEGTLWVGVEHGEVFGAANLNAVQLPEYEEIPWTFSAQPEEVRVIHTLVISPRWAGKGKAREFVTFC